MIKANEIGVMVQGNTERIAFEFTMIIKSVYAVLSDDMGEDNAKHMIADLGKIAFFDVDSEEKLSKQFEELADAWKGEENYE